MTSIQETSANAAYTAPTAALNEPTAYPFADGTYGATITDGAVEITDERPPARHGLR